MFSTKFKNFLYVGLIVSFSLFVGGITIGYFVEKHNQIENLQTRIKCLEKEITRINNECVHMREMDTLILNMSEYNDKDIESMTENVNELTRRVKKTEDDLNYLYCYD
jgi:archaellum component FlaC